METIKPESDSLRIEEITLLVLFRLVDELGLAVNKLCVNLIGANVNDGRMMLR